MELRELIVAQSGTDTAKGNDIIWRCVDYHQITLPSLKIDLISDLERIPQTHSELSTAGTWGTRKC